MSRSERKARLLTLNREWSRLKTIKRESVVSVMEWTGPGMFTDSVLAYLEARYGVRWPMLRGLTEPLRIGEVLILPITGASSFAAPITLSSSLEQASTAFALVLF
jgi:hypothetical protein